MQLVLIISSCEQVLHFILHWNNQVSVVTTTRQVKERYNDTALIRFAGPAQQTVITLWNVHVDSKF